MFAVNFFCCCTVLHAYIFPRQIVTTSRFCMCVCAPLSNDCCFAPLTAFSVASDSPSAIYNLCHFIFIFLRSTASICSLKWVRDTPCQPASQPAYIKLALYRHHMPPKHIDVRRLLSSLTLSHFHRLFCASQLGIIRRECMSPIRAFVAIHTQHHRNEE